MDMELHAAVVEIIESLDSRHNLPRSELRKIAEDTITEDKVTDGEWQYQRIQQSKKEFVRKRNIAHIRGYAPFCSLNQRVYTKLKETFGDDILNLMKKYLADPEDIYSKWSYRFARTVKEIGLEECLKHKEGVYHFVTGHHLWEELQQSSLESYRDWITDGQAEQSHEPKSGASEADAGDTAAPAGGEMSEAAAVAEPEAAADTGAAQEETQADQPSLPTS